MISIVIPALNEEENIRAAVATVISAAKAVGDMPIEIILVDDGSTDRTGEICDELASNFSFIKVVHHKTNLGLALAFQSALRMARYDQLTLCPGDNAVAHYTLRNIFLNRDKADYVLAVIMNTEYRGASRITLSAIHSLIYTVTFGLPIKYINAPALWPVPILRQTKLHAQRYSLHAELNVKLLRQPITFLEVDGYINPRSFKSSAVNMKSVVAVVYCYLRLCWEVFVTHRKEYSGMARRVLPPGVDDSDAE